jgi:multicomponent Na+:H+ antiporter subunit G
MILDVLSAVLLLSGAVLTLAAAVGVLRFPDVLSRMHAATKPQVLGLLLVLCGVGIELRESVDVWMLALAGGFQLLTAPIAAHLVGRLAYRTRHVRRDLLTLDDLERDSPPA